MNKIDVLQLANNAPQVRGLLQKAVERFSLDLRGLVVATEAATGAYAFTAVLAAYAGARVYAYARDSEYGSKRALCNAVRNIAAMARQKDRIIFFKHREADEIGKADIVTNSALLRPFDDGLIGKMRRGAVIALMYEPWELRPGEINLVACAQREVAVVGVNESHPLVDIFAYVGMLAVHMMLMRNEPILHSEIGVVSNDKFGKEISRILRKCGARVVNIQTREQMPLANGCDSLILADYHNTISVPRQCMTRWGRKGIQLFQFYGGKDVSTYPPGYCFPACNMQPRQMALTFAGLGIRPVLELHAASLKAAAIALGKRDSGFSGICAPII